MAERTLIASSREPVRLDAFVRAALPALSRRLVGRLIAAGEVRINGRSARKGTLARPGDRVTLPDLGPLHPEPELPVAVVYVDDVLIAIDKPGGMHGHALEPRQRGTAAAFLLGRFPDIAGIGTPLAPGLVHRLDTGTSGLLLAARTEASFGTLRTGLRSRQVEKRYLALVAGRMRHQGVQHITTALAHDPRARGRMIPATAALRSWVAESAIEVLDAGAERSLVRVAIRTGVTHQVRVHLALLGHPVLGDTVYGTPHPDLPPGRHALHAADLVFAHPGRGTRLEVHAPLPPELQRLLPCAAG